jgi:hypothetical protein
MILGAWFAGGPFGYDRLITDVNAYIMFLCVCLAVHRYFQSFFNRSVAS